MCSPIGSVNPAGQGPEKRLGTRAVQYCSTIVASAAVVRSVSLSYSFIFLILFHLSQWATGNITAEGGVPHLLWGTPRALGPRCWKQKAGFAALPGLI